MGAPYLGEVKMVSFSFPPKGWALCNGQSLAINQNQALFSILGTTYGGNGVTTFALPNLQGRVPVHPDTGGNYPLGSVGGSAAVTLASNQIGHTHPVNATATASSNTPGGNFPATGKVIYAPYNATGSATMNPNVIAPAGGSQPHNNLQPYTVINFIIALTGVFPSRT
jgi:microcystin-dependent protein